MQINFVGIFMLYFCFQFFPIVELFTLEDKSKEFFHKDQGFCLYSFLVTLKSYNKL